MAALTGRQPLMPRVYDDPRYRARQRLQLRQTFPRTRAIGIEGDVFDPLAAPAGGGVNRIPGDEVHAIDGVDKISCLSRRVARRGHCVNRAVAKDIDRAGRAAIEIGAEAPLTQGRAAFERAARDRRNEAQQ